MEKLHCDALKSASDHPSNIYKTKNIHSPTQMRESSQHDYSDILDSHRLIGDVEQVFFPFRMISVLFLFLLRIVLSLINCFFLINLFRCIERHGPLFHFHRSCLCVFLLISLTRSRRCE